jgi:N-acetylmuramoyl-L-alanine amidase
MTRWLLVLLALALPLTALADWRTPPPGEGPDSAPVRSIDGVDYVAINDLARLLDATKYWRPDLRRLELRGGPHVVALVADGPFANVDAAIVWMGAPARLVDGELQAPVALLPHLPHDATWPRLFRDERRDRVIVLPPSGRVGSPKVVAGAGATRLVFPADHPDEIVIVARSRDHFRVRFGGIFTGVLPDTFGSGALVRGIRAIASTGGTAFEVAVDRAADGFRVTPDPQDGLVTLEFARGEGLEAFAPEDPAGPRPLQVIVLDPGHGGTDPGTRAAGTAEKDLTLALARRLADELQHEMHVRVVLTREEDRTELAQERAEIANRAHADLVIALHFDGFSSGQARGATAYCAPATFAMEGSERTASVTLLPWRNVALRHAVQSRALAEAVLSSLELSGQGPARLRERLPYPLLGVNAPGILLECATLTAASDRGRVVQEEGMRQLAAAITRGVIAYQRHE